ncbi:MAG TPA: 4'-phosphopantetheinyl transferase superfamily protein [Saprospiraceae bacterium]|nr:4'-phosphopantetheinyl transferase superfamily protein [Saprospiraceae bacterium]
MHRISFGETHVAVGHHSGVHQYLDEHLTSEEKAIIDPLSPRKRTEWLASRELLFKISNLPQRLGCVYDEFGRPVLRGSSKHISISHSELWCAAMISDRPCGVDIQVYSDTVSRISKRFLTEKDELLARKNKHTLHELHLLWGTKECLYKAYGKRKLGFREHIFISGLHAHQHSGLGEIRYEGLHLQYEFSYRLLPEVAWVFCLQSLPAAPVGRHGM